MNDNVEDNQTGKTLIDQIFKDAGKVFDEKMYPLIIEDLKSQFQDSLREGKKQKIQLEKTELNDLLSTVKQEEKCVLDIDTLAENRLTVIAIDEKIVMIKKIYKELFDEDLN